MLSFRGCQMSLDWGMIWKTFKNSVYSVSSSRVHFSELYIIHIYIYFFVCTNCVYTFLNYMIKNCCCPTFRESNNGHQNNLNLTNVNIYYNSMKINRWKSDIDFQPSFNRMIIINKLINKLNWTKWWHP